MDHKNDQDGIMQTLYTLEARVASAASQADAVTDSMQNWNKGLKSMEEALLSLSASRNSVANEVTHLSNQMDSMNSILNTLVEKQDADSKQIWKEMVHIIQGLIPPPFKIMISIDDNRY